MHPRKSMRAQWSGRSLHHPYDRGVLAYFSRRSRIDDLAPLDHIEAVGELRHVVDVRLGDEHGVAEVTD
jgi:hypothetical protein